jgi:drug/metabolite transporter (DMT)-like permease
MSPQEPPNPLNAPSEQRTARRRRPVALLDGVRRQRLDSAAGASGGSAVRSQSRGASPLTARSPDVAAAWPRSRRSAELLLLVVVLSWSFNFTALKYALGHGFAPLALAPLRWGMAALAFVGLTWHREGSLRLARRDFALVAAAAIVGVGLNQITFVYALRLTTASTVALVFGLLAVLMSLMSHLGGLERLRLRHWLAAALSAAGVALVALGADGGIGGDLGGILLALATVASFAVYSVVIFPLTKRYSPNRLNAVSTLVGSAFLFATAPVQLAHQDWSAPSLLAWGALLYASLGAVVLGSGLWLVAIRRVGPGRAGLYANIQPFLGAVLAVAILSESLGTLQVVGGIIIGAAIVLARSHRQESERRPA